MHQRVRCAHCHSWTDALLVWAAGDCCPSCNAPMTLQSPPGPAKPPDAPRRGPGRFAGPSPSRLGRPDADRLTERL